jgi:hypothetical protein
MDQPNEMKKSKKIDKYEVEEAFRNICAAEKVKKNPELLAAVKKYAKEQGAAIAYLFPER